jgi:P-type Ca2+ transporter type 2C
MRYLAWHGYRRRGFWNMKQWHMLAGEVVAEELQVGVETGLSDAAAAARLVEHGPNVLTQEQGRSVWAILVAQFASLLVGILVAASVVSFLLGDVKDAIAIAAIIILNGVLGFKQEIGAERAMAALKKLSVPHVRVRRHGAVQEIEAAALVPGDVMLLEAGNMVPADGRLVVCAGLRVQEAALTGESEAVEKQLEALGDPEAPVGDRSNMVYMGTVVTYGRAEAICTGTGMGTELGQIATLLNETEDEATPLTEKIEQLGKVLVFVALGLITIVAVMGLLRGENVRTVFLTAVSMAVAAVPEGLPAVVTIALALGARRMLARQALIRNLPAVETLGSVTVICTDKTGTLTRNQMTVTKLVGVSGDIALPTEGASVSDDALVALVSGALCNDSQVGGGQGKTTEARRHGGDETGEELRESPSPGYRTERFSQRCPGEGEEASEGVIGDPTEVALVVAAADAGLIKRELEETLPRVGEAPFESDRKRMTTLHEIGAERPAMVKRLLGVYGAEGKAAIAFVKGAAAGLLEVSASVLGPDGVTLLDDAGRKKLLAANDALAGEGIRVLGLAYRLFDKVEPHMEAAELEKELVFVGLVGMIDPLRDDVLESVATVTAAGIRPVMITGDHPLMAAYIGRELGIIEEGTDVLTGVELARMSEAELRAAAAETQVFARVSPEQKLKLVDALQADGEIVSMTGDGVNDAPALKSADIGVAMGITGSDVAKEASDMVLLDDRYATIVSAVKEGRVIFDNIRRFVRFILSANAGELLVMLVGPLLGMPLPLLPVQILWMNLVTDGLPALALGVEGPEKDVMQRPPRKPDGPIVDRRMGFQILWIGALMALLSLWVGYRAWDGAPLVAATHGEGHGEAQAYPWQTMLFTTMVFAQLFLALAVRSSRRLLWQIGLFSNRPLLLAIAVTVVLQLGVIYVPVCASFFHTVPLSATQLGTCVGVAALLGIAVEIEKLLRRCRG